MISFLTDTSPALAVLSFLFIFGFAPRFALRLIVRAFPADSPRRRELTAEFHTVPRRDRPLWVAEQLECAISEGLGPRFRHRLTTPPRPAMWLIGWYPDKSERTSLIVVNEIQRAIEAVESEQWEGVDPDQISDYISSLVYSEIDFTVQDTFGAIDEDAMSRGKKLQSETANGSVATLGPLALSALASANFALFGDDVFDLAVAIVTIPSFLVLVWRNLRLQTHLYYRAIRISDCVRNLDPTQFRAT